MSSKKIVGRECRFAIHIQGKEGYRDDTHIVKEAIHFEDGTIKPNLRVVKNFERPYYITKKFYRNHKQKKSWEELSKVDVYKSTETDLAKNIQAKLYGYGRQKTLRELSSSPYLYGTYISSTSIIKHEYKIHFPDYDTPYTVCGLDIETSTIDDTINVITISYKDKVYTAVRKDLVEGHLTAEEDIVKKCHRYIGDVLENRKLKLEIQILDKEIDLVIETFRRLHRWKPDFVSIWNMDFDIPEIEKAIRRAGIEPRHVFSDPSLPDNLKVYQYKQGEKHKLTTSGKYSPLEPADQWHSVYTSSSFYIVDAMCVYKRVRVGAPKVIGGYGLDNILDKELKRRKLKFDVADKYTGLAWHDFMQRRYPLEYVVYNIWDVLSMMELEHKTSDISITLPTNAGVTDFSRYNSSSRLVCDDFHFYLLNKGYVLGTVDPEEKVDNRLLGLKNWIVVLQPNMLSRKGIDILEDVPGYPTNIFAYTFDSDATSAYPSGIEATNLSRETTKREIIDIDIDINNSINATREMVSTEDRNKIKRNVFNHNNINITTSDVNSVAYCKEMFGFPDYEEMLEMFEKENNDSSS